MRLLWFDAHITRPRAVDEVIVMIVKEKIPFECIRKCSAWVTWQA